MFLSREVCSVMTLEQLSSICRIAFSGFRSGCASGLPAELALHIDIERGSIFDVDAIRGFTPQFFRNLRPDIMAMWNATQVSGLQPAVCAEIRPEQFKHFATESFAGFNFDCVAAWNPALMELVTLDHLRHLQFGWRGFRALQFYTLIKRFGDDFWKLVEEIDTNKLWALSSKLRSFRQSDCFRSLFNSGLLNHTEGGFVQNWIIMASRTERAQYPSSSEISGVTLLAGLRSLKLNMINAPQIQYLSPSQFEIVSADEINLLDSYPMAYMEAFQIRKIRVEVIANITIETLDLNNGIFPGEFSCAQVQAVPEDKWRKMRFSHWFVKKMDWCQKPVNDSILYDGENGQRYSEEKLMHFYHENCDIDLSYWERQKQLISEREIEFSRNYKPLEIADARGCVCNYRLCYQYNQISGCFEESPQKCNKNDTPPPNTMDGTEEPPISPPQAPAPPAPQPLRDDPVTEDLHYGGHVSIEPGSVVGIVFGVLFIGALSGGLLVYKKYPEKLERFKMFRFLRRSEETSPLLT
jgi:hypothetical protein